MNRSRNACLLVFVLVAIALTPVRAYAAAPPRIVGLAEVAGNPVEVAISSKHLTLIHFETGDVSMVAVGDPGIVSVTVKGADVLLKALTSSGSTNAFIWQGGRYTLWRLTVRQNDKDPRLIIVKDLAASAGARVESRKSPEGTGEGGKPATSSTAAATVSGQPAVEASPASSATASTPPQQPSASPAQEHPKRAGIAHGAACGSSVSLDHFVKTLNAKQRELFSALLIEPSLSTLQALLLELSAQQRCSLLGLLSAPTSSIQPTSGTLVSIAPVSVRSGANAHQTNQVRNRAAESSCRSTPQGVESTEAQEGSLVKEDVVFSVTPTVIDGRLFLYYVLENHGEGTLLTDILRLRIFDGNANQLMFGINRATRDGYLGRLESDGVEYGVIAVDVPQKLLILEWKLIQFRSGLHQLVRVEVPVP